jgi:hypothetical protein
MAKGYIGVVYKAIDLNGKLYIGKHVGDGSDIGTRYFGSGTYFINARKKYGKDYFNYEIIEFCYSEEQLNERERYWIKFFNSKRPNGYNLTDGGDGNPGHVYSEESKKKMSESGIIAQNRPETKKKKSEKSKINFKDLWADPVFRIKTVNAQTEAQNRPEVRQNNSDIQKIVQNKPEVRNKTKESWINKSVEEKEKQADTGRYTNHIRWDVNRGIINPNCKFCVR